MDFLDRIEYYCKEHRISHSRFEALAGLSRGLISKWIRKGIFPNHRSQEKIAKLLGISVEELMLDFRSELDHSYIGPEIPTANAVEDGSSRPVPPFHRLPVVLDWSDLSGDTLPETKFFVLSAVDDSMYPYINRDDKMMIHVQDQADSGDIVILRIGDEIACRLMFTQDDGMILQTLDHRRKPIYYSSDDILTLPVTITGKVAALVHHFGK